MITLKKILKKDPILLNDWEGCSREEILRDFSEEDKEDVNILLASYSNENYEGNAFVLFEQGGKLYEVHGSHCSCYGLEGQWETEEVIIKEMINRLTKGTFGTHEFRNELRIIFEIE